jgi:hypothetical protein
MLFSPEVAFLLGKIDSIWDKSGFGRKALIAIFSFKALATLVSLAWLVGCALVFFWLADRDWATACLAAFSWALML